MERVSLTTDQWRFTFFVGKQSRDSEVQGNCGPWRSICIFWRIYRRSPEYSYSDVCFRGGSCIHKPNYLLISLSQSVVLWHLLFFLVYVLWISYAYGVGCFGYWHIFHFFISRFDFIDTPFLLFFWAGRQDSFDFFLQNSGLETSIVEKIFSRSTMEFKWFNVQIWQTRFNRTCRSSQLFTTSRSGHEKFSTKSMGRNNGCIV